jgi:preprotein translocase subunit YajC
MPRGGPRVPSAPITCSQNLERIVEQLFISMLMMVADDPGAAGDAAGGAPPSPGGGLLNAFLTIFLPIGLLFYFLLIRPQQRERKNREAMIRAVKPGDRVVTIGGIFGVVTNVHREADALTIRVDETNNTKLRVSLGAIARVLLEEPSKDNPSKKE